MTLAGEDPEWRQKMIGGYTDCYQVASNWPQQSLDRNPINKVFGRHMIFFKCAMVSPFPRELPFDCHPSETREEDVRDGPDVLLVEDLYGDSDDFNWSQFGLPQAKVKSPMNKFAK